jgi:hypothetical protein
MKRSLIMSYAGLLFVCGFSSCSESIESPIIEYYITATASSKYESLKITFDHTRAYQEGSESGTTAIRTVYLDKQDLSLTTDGNQEPVFLGASEIEAGKIYGYDFSFSFIAVTRNGVEVAVRQKDYNESNKVEKEFSLSPGEVKKIIFEINTNESISVLTNNDLKFLAKIQY